MDYQIYQSDNPDIIMNGFFGAFQNDIPIPFDKYELKYEGSVEPVMNDDGGTSISATLEQIFMIHNRDDRPNGQTMRSLSMGDLVFMKDAYYLVAMIGFIDVSSRIEKSQ